MWEAGALVTTAPQRNGAAATRAATCRRHSEQRQRRRIAVAVAPIASTGGGHQQRATPGHAPFAASHTTVPSTVPDGTGPPRTPRAVRRGGPVVRPAEHAACEGRPAGKRRTHPIGRPPTWGSPGGSDRGCIVVRGCIGVCVAAGSAAATHGAHEPPGGACKSHRSPAETGVPGGGGRKACHPTSRESAWQQRAPGSQPAGTPTTRRQQRGTTPGGARLRRRPTRTTGTLGPHECIRRCGKRGRPRGERTQDRGCAGVPRPSAVRAAHHAAPPDPAAGARQSQPTSGEARAQHACAYRGRSRRRAALASPPARRRKTWKALVNPPPGSTPRPGGEPAPAGRAAGEPRPDGGLVARRPGRRTPCADCEPHAP